MFALFHFTSLINAKAGCIFKFFYDLRVNESKNEINENCRESVVKYFF